MTNNLIALPESLPVPRWENAACRGLPATLFYPEPGDIAGVRHAREVCARCEIREACLQFALDNNETIGVWGGTSSKDRRQMKHRAAVARRGARQVGS